MKTKLGTKLLSFLLCVCMLIPMFTACGNTDDKPLSWEVTEDQVIPLEMEIQNGDGNTSLVLTYSEDVFSSIETEQIKLTVYQKATPILDEALEGTADGSISERMPTDFTASVTNAKQLTIIVPNAENDWGYLVTVHSSAISSGKFGEAFGFKTEIIEDSVSYSASILGEHEVGDVNPVITVTLENTVAAAGLTKDMFTLTGLFEGLEITSVSGSESTITIVTSGTVAVATPFFAGVELAEGATNSGVELTADCEVAYRSAYVKQDSFALASGTLTFDAVIVSDTVTLAVNDTLTADGITYTVKAVSEDKTTVTLGVATTASDLDSAIAEINGKTLEIPANKTASANAHTLTIYAISASVGGSVDYIEETATANTYSATAILFVKNGVWNGTLTTSDITFGGDFDGATVTSVTKDGNSYEVVFTFTKEGLDLDALSLDGFATVSAGKVKNAWGTALTETDAELTYVTGLDRGEGWDTIKAFVTEHKSTFKTIGTVGSAVGGVASAAGGVVKILELVGVIESTNDKIDNLKREMQTMNESLQKIDEKINNLGQMIATGNTDTLTAVHKNTYLTASNGWNSFLSSYVAPLSNAVSDYKLAYNTYMLNYINTAGTSDSITVYIDVNGNVTLPGAIDGYSIDGVKIASVTECSLSEELSDVKQKVIQNRGRLYDEYWDDMNGFLAGGFASAQAKGKKTYNAMVPLLYNALKKNFAGVYALRGNTIVNRYANKVIFDQKTYNQWVFSYGEGDGSKDHLHTTYYPYFYNNPSLSSLIYSMLGEKNYWYNDDRIAEMDYDEAKVYPDDSHPLPVLLDADGNAIEEISNEQYCLALQLDAAIYAMNTVGTSNILNAYTNFCNALTGHIGGSSASASTMKPLDYYYQIMSTYYNFYVEAKEDINVTHAWLHSLLIESSGLATMAYEYTPGAADGLVNTAYNAVLSEIATNNGAHEDHYSYLAGKKLTVDRVYENMGVKEVNLSLVTTAYGGTVYSFPTSYMSEGTVKAMIARFEQLKKASITSSANFAAYLASFGLLESGLEKAIIVVSVPVKQEIPTNNSLTLTVHSCNSKGSYFYMGNTYAIGSNGKRKAKYYDDREQLMANTVSMDGNYEWTRLIAYAGYYESFFLSSSEWAHLSMRVSNPLLVFKLD